MIESKDTTDLEMTAKMTEMKLKKVSKNYLYFKKRARSRSFIKLTPLFQDNSDGSESSDDDCFGVNGEGQKIAYAPKSTEIKKFYTEELKLFEDVLSPTLVTFEFFWCGNPNK